MVDKTPEKEADTETITYTRKKTKGKREEDLSGLPVIIENHELTEEQLKTIIGEDEYHRLPDQVYKKLEIIPAQFNVREHHIAVYKCNRTGMIAKADHPYELFDKSIASASLVSYIMDNKYSNAMPLLQARPP
ncbi:MAG: IS66 family transposase zinc-finger binding domain-containing protein [Clostridia bacterium]|nr:IS66 family transposase zinc-finger binding domain-containing protein [Clostridia bacterium]